MYVRKAMEENEKRGFDGVGNIGRGCGRFAGYFIYWAADILWN